MLEIPVYFPPEIIPITEAEADALVREAYRIMNDAPKGTPIGKIAVASWLNVFAAAAALALLQGHDVPNDVLTDTDTRLYCSDGIGDFRTGVFSRSRLNHNLYEWADYFTDQLNALVRTTAYPGMTITANATEARYIRAWESFQSGVQKQTLVLNGAFNTSNLGRTRKTKRTRTA